MYHVLCRLSRDERVQNVPMHRIAFLTGISRTTAFALLKTLERYQLIKRVPVRGRPSAYLLLDVDDAIRALKHNREEIEEVVGDEDSPTVSHNDVMAGLRLLCHKKTMNGDELRVSTEERLP
jgi:hypothetical protein